MENKEFEDLLSHFKNTIEEVKNDNFDNVENLKDSVLSFLESKADKKQYLSAFKQLNIELQDKIEEKVSSYSKELEEEQKRAANIAKYQSNNLLRES